jgi:hypothetical protein
VRLFGSGKDSSPHEAATGALSRHPARATRVAFSPPGESDSCRLIYICWIPLQGQSTAGARRSCIWSHLGKPQTHLHIAPH